VQALGSLSRLPSAHLQNVPPPSTHLPRRRHTRPRTFMIDADTTAPVGSRCSWAVSLGGRLVWVDSYGQAHGATDTADRWHCAQRCATFHPPAVNVANCACVLVLVLHARKAGESMPCSRPSPCAHPFALALAPALSLLSAANEVRCDRPLHVRLRIVLPRAPHAQRPSSHDNLHE
jgi:hypothetical protein